MIVENMTSSWMLRRNHMNYEE